MGLKNQGRSHHSKTANAPWIAWTWLRTVQLTMKDAKEFVRSWWVCIWEPWKMILNTEIVYQLFLHSCPQMKFQVPFCTIDPTETRAFLEDERFDWLVAQHKPKSEMKAQKHHCVMRPGGHQRLRCSLWSVSNSHTCPYRISMHFAPKGKIRGLRDRSWHCWAYFWSSQGSPGSSVEKQQCTTVVRIKNQRCVRLVFSPRIVKVCSVHIQNQVFWSIWIHIIYFISIHYLLISIDIMYSCRFLIYQSGSKKSEMDGGGPDSTHGVDTILSGLQQKNSRRRMEAMNNTGIIMDNRIINQLPLSSTSRLCCRLDGLSRIRMSYGFSFLFCLPYIAHITYFMISF